MPEGRVRGQLNFFKVSVVRLLAAHGPLTLSQLSRNQPVHGGGGVVELLVGCVTIARFHLGNEPAIVAHFGERGSNGWPIVVAQKQVGVNALVTAASPPLHHIFHMNPSNARSVHFNPLFRETSVVNVAHIKVNAHIRAVYFIEKLPELPWTDQKALFGVAILAADLDFGLGCFSRKNL